MRVSIFYRGWMSIHPSYMILGLFWPIHIFKSSKTLNPKLKQRETSQNLFLDHVFPPNLSSYMCHVNWGKQGSLVSPILRKHLLGENQTLNKWRLLKLGDPIRHLSWLFGFAPILRSIQMRWTFYLIKMGSGTFSVYIWMKKSECFVEHQLIFSGTWQSLDGLKKKHKRCVYIYILYHP